MSATPSIPPSQRSGLLAAGNFIIDHVKVIDYYPQEETLATILTQSSSSGGGAYNVLKNLSKMGVHFPLAAAGLVGADDGARWILDDCRNHGINTDRLGQSPLWATSYTDAFTVQGTGRRTFFHQPGANAHLQVEDITLTDSSAKIFYLGYLMLLDALDALAPTGRTGASHVLEAASEAGFMTVSDLVSKYHADFEPAVRASLPHVDYLVLNEIEAGAILGEDCPARGNLVVPAEKLLGLGVRRGVVLHTEFGSVAVDHSGGRFHQGSVRLPAGFSQGATGAGDAFAAGVIYGLHEEWSLLDTLRLAVCAAAASLRHPSTSEGMLPLQQCLELGEQFGYVDAPGER